MKRFKNILSVYDGGSGAEDALDQAILLARSNQARLTIVDLIEDNDTSISARRGRERGLQRLLPGIKAESVDEAEAHVLVGTPFLEIIRHVLRARHDLVIANAEGGSVVRNVFFGSTATHLVRKCPCPVWIIKPGQTVHYGRILAAIDPALDEPRHDTLNRKILDLATSLASMSGARLDIVHVWDVAGNDRDTLASEAPASVHAEILHRHEQLHHDAVHAILQDYSLAEIDYEILLHRGLPRRVLVEIVQERRADLVVMGTVNQTGIPGLIIGNAAETVLGAVRCGVLAVKPDGFVSPVTLS